MYRYKKTPLDSIKSQKIEQNVGCALLRKNLCFAVMMPLNTRIWGYSTLPWNKDS